MSDSSTRPNLAPVNAGAEPETGFQLQDSAGRSAVLSAVLAAENVNLPSAPAEGVFVSFPDSPFQLFQPYPPAGDQPVAINQLVEGLEDGLAYQTLLGVTGSGKTFTMANVIARMGRPAIVFAPNKTLAAPIGYLARESIAHVRRSSPATPPSGRSQGSS